MGKSLKEFLSGYFLLLAPAVIVQELTVYLFTHGFFEIYFTFSGWRLPVLIASFLVGGILLAWITDSERLRLFVVIASVLTFLVRYYFACDLFECYYLQDLLQLVRLGMLMAGLAVIGNSFGVQRRYKDRDLLRRNARQYLLGFSIIYVLSYFPLSTEFAGLAGYPGLSGLRLLFAFLVTPLISGLATLDLISDRTRAFVIYLFSVILTLLVFLSLPCDGCETRLNLLLVGPAGPVFAGLIGILGTPTISRIISQRRRTSSTAHKFLGFLALALLIVSLPLTIVASFRGATPEVLDGVGNFGPKTTPYVGVYDAIPYIPSCCVSATIILSIADQSIIGASNYLRAGIGVQAPNHYVDGLDYGYRLDVLLSNTGNAQVEANAWEICDANLACGGVPWQTHLYRNISKLSFHSGILTLNLSIRMDSASRQAFWYMNDTVMGVLRLPSISLTSLSTGVTSFGNPTWLNFPYGEADFLQFGVESANPIQSSGWSVTILNPSYMENGTWITIEHASVIQGPASFWKVLWVWGGKPYNGVSIVRAASPESGFTFSYTGATTPDHYVLW